MSHESSEIKVNINLAMKALYKSRVKPVPPTTLDETKSLMFDFSRNSEAQQTEQTAEVKQMKKIMFDFTKTKTM